MNLSKNSQTPSLLRDRSGATANLSMVADRIADCVRNVIPHPAAIFVPGETPFTYSAENFPVERLDQIRNHFKNNAQLLADLMTVSDRLSEPHRFSDGSCVFLLPLVHDGILEAVLCLYDSGKREQELLQQHLLTLEPICRLAATFISHIRENESEARSIQGSPAGNPAGNPQNMVHLVSGLLRTVSHDIRTPITAVRGFAKMMLDGRAGPISDSQRECLQLALNGVDQLIGVAASVSGASRLIEQIRPEVLDFPELWQTVMKAGRTQLLAKAVTVEESIDLDHGAICGDRQALIRALERLLACAVRNVEHGGTLRVELRCRNELALILTVPGAPSLAEAEEDLAAVREVVFLHGGQIALRPGSPGGQTLTLSLPGYFR
jgi:signal transduction histidine kinase